MIGLVIFILILLIVMDSMWFSWSLSGIYTPMFEKIQHTPLKARLSGGIVAWLLIAAGISYFAVRKNDTKKSFLNGLILGGIVYGVYNGTNYATFSEYSESVAFIDTLWGMFITSTVSAIASTI